MLQLKLKYILSSYFIINFILLITSNFDKLTDISNKFLDLYSETQINVLKGKKQYLEKEFKLQIENIDKEIELELKKPTFLQLINNTISLHIQQSVKIINLVLKEIYETIILFIVIFLSIFLYLDKILCSVLKIFY